MYSSSPRGACCQGWLSSEHMLPGVLHTVRWTHGCQQEGVGPAGTAWMPETSLGLCCGRAWVAHAGQSKSVGRGRGGWFDWYAVVGTGEPLGGTALQSVTGCGAGTHVQHPLLGCAWLCAASYIEPPADPSDAALNVPLLACTWASGPRVRRVDSPGYDVDNRPYIDHQGSAVLLCVYVHIYKIKLLQSSAYSSRFVLSWQPFLAACVAAHRQCRRARPGTRTAGTLCVEPQTMQYNRYRPQNLRRKRRCSLPPAATLQCAPIPDLQDEVSATKQPAHRCNEQREVRHANCNCAVPLGQIALC